MVSGGTSGNTIAQSGELLYEYRSDQKACLEEMEKIFKEIVSRCTPADGKLLVEKIGDRPCAGELDEAAMGDLVMRGAAAVNAVTGQEAVLTKGSTDCNSPLSVGIPAICLGVCIGGKCHTREEWLDTSSLADGCRLFMEFFNNYLVN